MSIYESPSMGRHQNYKKNKTLLRTIDRILVFRARLNSLMNHIWPPGRSLPTLAIDQQIFF